MKGIVTSIILLNLIFSSVLSVSAECKVEYEGAAEGLIAVPDNFFEEFGIMMPADIKKEVVTIKNNENRQVEFYFHTKLEENLQNLIGKVNDPKTEEERAAVLLEKARLTIWLGKDKKKETIYDGNLAAATLKKGVSLGKYNAGEEGELLFQIEIPKEIGNIYANSNTDVIWIFSTKADSDSIPEETTESKKEPNDSKDQNIDSPPSNVDKRESSDPVILGISDYSWILGSGLIIGGVLGGIWLIFRRKKE